MVPSVSLDPVRSSTLPRPPIPLPTDAADIRRPTSDALSQPDRVTRVVTTEPVPGHKLAEHVPGELLIRFRPEVSAQALENMMERLGLQVIKKFPKPTNLETETLDNLYHVKITSGLSVEQAMEQLNKLPQVVYAEPNYIARVLGNPVIPNDLDTRLWGIRNTGQNGGKAGADVHAVDAWSVTTGSKTSSPLIAVIDTGIDHRHPEISPNVFANPGEVPGNGRDDDNNGYVDDVYGYDFANKDGDPMDDNSHGTHVSGTIAAKGNNGSGIVGVMWDARLMGVKFLSGSGSGSYADAISAVLYATQRGARVTSNSWGGSGFSQALKDAMAASPAIHIAAAGNDGHDNDRTPSYPAAFGLPNIVAVAATDRNDHLASFSNWGAQGVHVAAPGVDVYSTTPNNNYATYSGTSMATPHVSGVVGLILTKYPNLSNEQIKARLINSVDPIPELQGKIVSGGRVNAADALAEDNAPPAPITDLSSQGASESAVVLSWTATGDDGRAGQAKSYDLRYSTRPILTPQDWEDATRVPASAPKASGQQEQVRVGGLQPSEQGTRYYFGLKALDKVGNATSLATATATTLPARIVFSDDMEQDNANWQPQAPWGKVATDHGRSFTDSPSGNYADNANTSLVSKALDLSGLRSATLSALLKWDLENNYDFGYVEISKDGGQSWSQLDKFTGTSGWARKTFDLSSFAGNADVRVRFRLTTDSSVQKDGIYVDEVAVISGDTQIPIERER